MYRGRSLEVRRVVLPNLPRPLSSHTTPARPRHQDPPSPSTSCSSLLRSLKIYFLHAGKEPLLALLHGSVLARAGTSRPTPRAGEGSRGQPLLVRDGDRCAGTVHFEGRWGGGRSGRGDGRGLGGPGVRGRVGGACGVRGRVGHE